MKTALLFGTSGLVGSHILDQLLVDQYYGHIKVFARKPLQINNKKVELIITDFLDIATYSHAISGDDCFFSIGTTGKITPDRAEFSRIEFTIPIDIANFAKKNSIKSFLYVSTMGANHKSFSLYLKNKGNVENNLMDMQFSNLAIVRPSLLLGDRFSPRKDEQRYKKAFRLLNPLLIGGMRQYRPILAKIVAEAMINIAKNKTDQKIYKPIELSKLAG